MQLRPTLLLLIGIALAAGALAPARAARLGAFAAPTLKWQYGGCSAPPHYCDTGWYASPAVADLDGDGKPEVVWASYDLYALNGESGSVQWTAANGYRAWPGVVVTDLTGDGSLEVVVGRGNDQLTVYSSAGGEIWTRNPFGAGEIRTLSVDDLDGDGKQEIVVGRAGSGATKQVSVYEPDGSVRPGWPARHDGDSGNGWGMYNENVAIADLNGDGQKEIFAPTDTHYITALRADGSQLPASPIYGAAKAWSEVGVHVDLAVDLRGWASCGTEHRPNFADSAPAVADVDGDGTQELIVVGNVYNCGTDPYTSLYRMPFILNVDRTRWHAGGFDWTAIPAPLPGSGPLAEDYRVIETAAENAVVADLDGDGRKEILYPSYDGRLHVFWLDKTEHGGWPFKVQGSGIHFASEPAVVDIDDDGRAEIIFTSWPQVDSGQVGQLHVLDYLGNQLYAVNLPAPAEGASWNGGLGAPTVANIDADSDLEIVVGTSHSGLVAYDLPGSSGARVLWGTGRGGQKRTGVAPQVLTLGSARAAQAIPAGSAASYTIKVSGITGGVTLSAGTPSGPAPLPAVSISPAGLTAPGQAILTLTDKHAPGPLLPGAAYRVEVTATGGGNTRKLTLSLLVGGTARYVPATRR